MSKAATMEIPINSNGDSRNLAEDDSLEQVSDTCDSASPHLVISVSKSGPVYLWIQVIISVSQYQP